jgi:glyceraldehyde 3-phosphate dehydrogenase
VAAAAPLRVGINGFGSIGRRFFRQAEGRSELRVMAINDIGDLATLAHLLKYDSSYGPFAADVRVEDSGLVVGGRAVRVFGERDPAGVPWREAGVDVVLEATGLWTDRRAALHLDGGARRVVVTAPAIEEDVTLIMGVNEHGYDPDRHRVISGASCTTQCLAVTCKALDDAFGVQRALCTTVHAYTNDQRLLDLPHRDLRRARGAGLNIIPTASSAARAVEKALPHLRGRLGASSFRVPVASVSVIDVVAELARPVDAEAVNEALVAAAASPRLKGRLGTSREPLVSQDFRGDPRSAIVDLPLTQVVDGTLCEVVAWYDNEWGYSARLVDLLVYLAARGV